MQLLWLMLMTALAAAEDRVTIFNRTVGPVVWATLSRGLALSCHRRFLPRPWWHSFTLLTNYQCPYILGFSIGASQNVSPLGSSQTGSP